VNPAAEGSEPSGHPNGRKADSGWPRRSVKPDPPGHCRFDTCSAHPVLVAQWIARVVPNYEVDRSNRSEDAMTRIALAREATANSLLYVYSPVCLRVSPMLGATPR
jgi:hypothetical protein